MQPESGACPGYGRCPNTRPLPNHGPCPKKQLNVTVCKLLCHSRDYTNNDTFYLKLLIIWATKVKQWVAAICQGRLQLIHVKQDLLVGNVIAKIMCPALSMLQSSALYKALVTGHYEISKNPKLRFEFRKINSCNLFCLNYIFRLDPVFYTRTNDIHVIFFLLHSFIISSAVVSHGNSLSFSLDPRFTLNLTFTDLIKLKYCLHAKTIKRSNSSPTIGNREKAIYKDLHHRITYCKRSLSGDIEVNPGPTFVDPTKTIHAPYSQGNVHVFGENAGRQCVPMSLCSLIYVYRNGSILDSTTLVNIMNLGN